MYKILSKKGISPVIGVILLVAVTVALVSLATIIVFDLGSNVNETADSSIQVTEKNNIVSVNIIRNENVEEFKVLDNDNNVYPVQSSVGSISEISYSGGVYSVIAIMRDGSEEVIYTGYRPFDANTLSFTVFDENNNSIEGITVFIDGFEDETDENGEVSFELEEGEYNSTIFEDGLSGVSNTFEITENTDDISIDIEQAEQWRHSEHDDGFFPLNVNTLDVSDDIIYTGSEDETVIAYNATSLDKFWRHSLHSETVETVYESDGILYSGARDDIVIAVDSDTGIEIWRHELHSNTVQTVYESDSVLYSGSSDNTVIAFNIDTQEEIWRHELHTDRVNSIYESNGILYSGANDNTIIAFDINTEEEIWEYEPTDNGWVNSVQEQDGTLYIGYVFDDGTYFSIVAGLNSVDGTELWEHQLHEDDFFIQSVYGDEGTVYSASQDGNVIAYGLNVNISE